MIMQFPVIFQISFRPLGVGSKLHISRFSLHAPNPQKDQQTRFIMQKYFLDCYSLSKNSQKNTFDFIGLYIGASKSTTIFFIKYFPPNTVILNYGDDTRDFFFGVCYAFVTRLKTLSRLKQSILNGVLNIRLKRFKYFKQKNK